MSEEFKKILVRSDNSEIIPYTIENIPMYVKSERMSHYPTMTAMIHWHDDIEFIHVISGKMMYMVSDRLIEINQGDVIFVNTQQPHGHRHIEYEECIFNAVLIPTEVLKYPESLIKKYVDSVFYDSKFASFVFRKGDRGHAKLAKTIDDMVEKADMKEDAYEFDMIACGYKLMAEIIKRLNCKGAEKIGVSPWADTLHKMIAFIQFNYKDPIKLEEIAEAGNVSRSQCCKIFKEIINRSPNDYLVEYRIDKSIDLIMKTDMKMTDIAYECGFNGSSYFAETFKKIVGVSPREYKNKEKKKCTTI